MTIRQEVKLSMSDIIDMLKSKLGMKTEATLDNVVITDYLPEPKVVEDTEGVGETKDIIASALVKKSNIVNVLKEGLKGANASNKFPKDANKVCADAMSETLAKFSTKEAYLFREIIDNKNFANFAVLWQIYQTSIQQKL